MKDLLNIYLKDIHVENFSKRECVVYGVIVPMMLVVGMYDCVNLLRYGVHR